MHFLGMSTQLPESTRQWMLIWVRVEHFWMALHSGIAFGIQYHSDW